MVEIVSCKNINCKASIKSLTEAISLQKILRLLKIKLFGRLICKINRDINRDVKRLLLL